MESNAGLQQWSTRLTLALSGGIGGPLHPAITPYPFPSASSVGRRRKEGIGGARGLGNLVSKYSRNSSTTWN